MYKIINNSLDFKYWIDVLNSIQSFKKIKFSELFKSIKDEQIQKESDKITNEIVVGTVLNIRPINDILSSLPDDEFSTEIKDETIKKAEPIIKKVKKQQEIISNKIEGSETEVWDKKAIIISNDIEAKISWKRDTDYNEKIQTAFWINSDVSMCEHLNTLFKYKTSSNLTWIDIWVIAWSINSFFSYYFQSLFVEISNINNYIYDDDLEWDAWYVLNKILKNQTLEIYEMFKFVNRLQSNSRTELITKLEKQENKDKYNLLKWFLDSESMWWVELSHFYKITLNNLRKFRNFHAHHNDERAIEKIINRNYPEKFKMKFYNKFLWDLDEDWKWFLQYIMERM